MNPSCVKSKPNGATIADLVGNYLSLLNVLGLPLGVISFLFPNAFIFGGLFAFLFPLVCPLIQWYSSILCYQRVLIPVTSNHLSPSLFSTTPDWQLYTLFSPLPRVRIESMYQYYRFLFYIFFFFIAAALFGLGATRVNEYQSVQVEIDLTSLSLSLSLTAEKVNIEAMVTAMPPTKMEAGWDIVVMTESIMSLVIDSSVLWVWVLEGLVFFAFLGVSAGSSVGYKGQFTKSSIAVRVISTTYNIGGGLGLPDSFTSDGTSVSHSLVDLNCGFGLTSPLLVDVVKALDLLCQFRQLQVSKQRSFQPRHWRWLA